MILAGHQPEYLPYIGLFHKITLCDTFIFVNHVQFNKKSWQNRNRTRCNTGERLLTIPVLTRRKQKKLWVINQSLWNTVSENI